MEPLGRFCESCRSFSRTFGRLLENVAKIIRKVTKVHQKSTKGGPKAPKNSVPHPPRRRPSRYNRVCFFLQKDTKTGVKNLTRFYPSSIAPAILLEPSGTPLKPVLANEREARTYFKSQLQLGASRSHEEPRGANRSQEEQLGAIRSQQGPRGTTGKQ